jgi:hypothetical protein
MAELSEEEPSSSIGGSKQDTIRGITKRLNRDTINPAVMGSQIGVIF